jgi:hypothetical protein
MIPFYVPVDYLLKCIGKLDDVDPEKYPVLRFPCYRSDDIQIDPEINVWSTYQVQEIEFRFDRKTNKWELKYIK